MQTLIYILQFLPLLTGFVYLIMSYHAFYKYKNLEAIYLILNTMLWTMIYYFNNMLIFGV